ncbi:MAG: hypothetical protein RI885_2651 [Actinomycetota bacterium]|jgi:type VII secretion integral membrane protein EccD
MAASTTSLPPRRVTVVSPRAQADVSLPGQAIIGDVVTQLAALAAADRAGTLGPGDSARADAARADAAGWVLTTLLGSTLDDEQTVAQAGIRDGDLLYLQPRTPTVPEPLFDDVVDAVALTTGARHRWGPEQTRASTLVVAAIVATAGLVLLRIAPAGHAVAPVAGLTALLLLGASALFGRVLRRDGPAVVALGLGVGYAVVAGGTLLADARAAVAAFDGAVERPDPFSVAPDLLLAAVFALAAGATGLLTVPGRGAVVAFVAWSAGPVAVLASVTILLDTEPARVAGVGAVAVVLAAPAWPTIALRLGRVPMPRIPRDVSDFTELTSTDDTKDSVAAARESGRHLTAIIVATGLVVAGCAVVVVGQRTGWACALATTLVIAMLARARHLRATSSKASALAVGILSGLLVVGGIASLSDVDLVVPLTGVVVVGTTVTCLLVDRSPVRRPSPHRARWLDVVEILALVALVPLLLGVLDLYATLRGIGG